MTRELIGKRLRNEFREFLVRWVLREIESEFEAAEIGWDRTFQPQVSGERRTCVEQHYHTLDLSKHADARRLIQLFGSIIARAEQNLVGTFDPAAEQRAVEGLKSALLLEGLRYDRGRITPTTREAREIFDGDKPTPTISEVTRRAIFDELTATNVAWWGRLGETEFLGRLYKLDALPSSDPRYRSMIEDIIQHRVRNDDWPDSWVYEDDRLDLLRSDDESFLRFLCELVHPVVRSDANECIELVRVFSSHLHADGWEMVIDKQISGKPVYVARARSATQVQLPEALAAVDVLSVEYVRELSDKCDARLKSRDYEGAITVGRTLLEAILGELEERLAGQRGDYKGELPKQFKRVTKLLQMDDERPDIDERFKDVIRGLVMVANGLAPLRNKLSDGHARAKRPAPHHASLVVNAAKTSAAFLVESYKYQASKGRVGSAATGEGESQ